MAIFSTKQPELIYGIFTPHCYAEFFHNYNFFNLHCLRLVISKLLGYSIILGSVAVKLPQILKIVNSGNADGLQVSMYLLENIGYTIAMSYNLAHHYPFSTYGENVFLALQGTVLIALTAYFQHSVNIKFFAGAILYTAFSYTLLSGMLEPSQLSTLQSSTIPIFAAAKLPQIYSNYRAQSTGQLSVVTCGLNFAGALARVFTTIQEVKDPLLLVGVLSGVSLNGMLLLQIVLYWENKDNNQMKDKLQ